MGTGRGAAHATLLLLTLTAALAQTDTARPQTAQPAAAQPASAQPTATQPSASGAPSTGTASTGESGAGAASEGARVELTRRAKDGSRRIIRVVRTGDSDQTGIFTSCAPQDSDPAGSPTLSVFSESGAGGVRVTVDKNVIVGALALVTQQDGGDGHIEVTDGSARYLDDAPKGPDGQPLTDRLSRCEVQASPKVTPGSVHVTQGRTTLQGSKLVYDESDGLAQISGPISFARAASAGSGSLTGASDRIEVDVDRETTTLVGHVTLKDGARVSTAERVDYDDAANVAILRGTAANPARSDKPGETLVAPVIRYNLDTGSLVVLGPVSGAFQDGDGPSAGGTDAGSAGNTPSAPVGVPPSTPSVPGR